MSYFFSCMDTDSAALAEAGLTVYTFILTQPTAFSLATLFTLTFPRIWSLFGKSALGMRTPRPAGGSNTGRDVTRPGVGHGDDLGYLFPMAPPGFPRSVVTPAQLTTRDHLLNIVETFARTGRPSAGGGEVWRAVGGRVAPYLEVGEELGMARDTAFASKLELWRGWRERSRAAEPPLADHPPAVYHDKIACKRLISK